MPSRQHILAVPYWYGVAQYKTALGKAWLLSKGKHHAPRALLGLLTDW